MFTVDGVDKSSKQREVMGSFKSARKLTGLVGDAFKIWRATR
jgi:electron transfer flavoprotein-quinone oxidoreductase